MKTGGCLCVFSAMKRSDRGEVDLSMSMDVDGGDVVDVVEVTGVVRDNVLRMRKMMEAIDRNPQPEHFRSCVFLLFFFFFFSFFFFFLFFFFFFFLLFCFFFFCFLFFCFFFLLYC